MNLREHYSSNTALTEANILLAMASKYICGK